MIVKMHARGAGGGAGPTGYLLGKDGNREGASVLRGDPEQTRELIDASRYAKKYTSGVLSFAEHDMTAERKNAVMDDFERTLMPGLDADQYDCLWVEHSDKGRVELNFVIPNTELTTGKRLQPYYDRADRPRVDAWQTLTNARYGFHDPNDPANQRALTYPANLPRDKLQAQRQITDGMLSLAERGEVTNRAEVVDALEGAGFDVTRQTKTSISVADPDGGRPLRLRGKLYERDFALGEGLREEIDRASREYRESRSERLQGARERLDVGIERKREDNQRRYPRPEPAAAKDRAQELDGRDHSRGADLAAGSRDDGDDGLVHEPTGGADRTPQGNLGNAGSRGQRDRAEPVRRSVVRENSGAGQSGVRRQRPIPHPEGVLDDRARARVAERTRRLTERIRDAAERLASRLRELAGDVRGDTPRQSGPGRTSEDLERAGDALERSEGQQDRALSEAGAELERASGGLEREREALDARGQDAVKQQVSQQSRDDDFGMDM